MKLKRQKRMSIIRQTIAISEDLGRAGKGSQTFMVEMDLRGFTLFGYLVESLEGIACHSRAEGKSAMLIDVLDSQLSSWREFLACWDSFQITQASSTSGTMVWAQPSL